MYSLERIYSKIEAESSIHQMTLYIIILLLVTNTVAIVICWIFIIGNFFSAIKAITKELNLKKYETK
jgi:hypothetical protein